MLAPQTGLVQCRLLVYVTANGCVETRNGDILRVLQALYPDATETGGGVWAKIHSPFSFAVLFCVGPFCPVAMAPVSKQKGRVAP